MTRPTKFAVLLGGPITATERLLRQVADCRSIAADSGMAHARQLLLQPELWVGDFDSADPQTEADFSHVPRQIHPSDKDATDGEIAIEAAIARGASDLILVGGLGGQSDHALGHMGLLLALARRGISAFATSGDEEAYPLISGSRLALALPDRSRLSIIAIADLEGLDITGVRWPLTDANVVQGSTRTLSNVSQSDAKACQSDVKAFLRSGSAMLIAYPGGS